MLPAWGGHATTPFKRNKIQDQVDLKWDLLVRKVWPVSQRACEEIIKQDGPSNTAVDPATNQVRVDCSAPGLVAIRVSEYKGS